MRPKLLAPTLTLALLALPLAARADTEPEEKPAPTKPTKKNVVLADLGLHVIGLGFQRTITPHVAISISGGLYDPWTVTAKVGDLRGGILRLRPYFFVNDEAPRGFWISPFVQAGSVTGVRDGVSASGPTGALGVGAGYAFLIGNIVHLSLGLGGQLHGAKLPGSAKPPSFYTAGLHLDATAGVAF